MSGRKTSALADLPSYVVTERAALEIEQLRRWCDAAGERFVLADCAACRDRKAVLRQIGRAFEFPDWYGANLDALYDCLTDLAAENAPGLLVVLEGLSRRSGFSDEDRGAVLDVFRDALEPFAEAGVKLRVLYR